MSRRAVVIFGGTRGLGAALAHELLYQADHASTWYDSIVAVGRDPESIENPTTNRVELQTVKMDLHQAMWYDIQTKLLEQDVCPVVAVNAAAQNHIAHTTALTPERVLRLVRLNALSSMEIAKALVQADTSRLEGMRPALINIGSNACDGAGKDSLAYVVSKHALTGVTRSLARDYAGVLSVLQVNPPLMLGTDMSNQIVEAYANRWGVGLAEAARRYAETSPGGEIMPVENMAEWLCELVSLRHSLQNLHGSILRMGYAS